MARGELFIGTSGYSYPQWKGTFYPSDLPNARMLEYYSGIFRTTELNNTFYRFPSVSALEGWRSTTPDGFRFSVKANQRITHHGRLKDVEETTRDFVDRCGELGDRLGVILFQLPPYLKRDDGRLADFLDALPPGARYAMEFRDEGWFDDAVFDRLSDAGVALCLAEADELAPPRVVTADFAYLRLRKERYSEAELTGWSGWIDERLSEGRDVFAYIKHDEGGVAAEYAERLAAPRV